jgi:hypothetical protein
VNSRVSLSTWGGRKTYIVPHGNPVMPLLSSPQPSHYTDYVIMAPLLTLDTLHKQWQDCECRLDIICDTRGSHTEVSYTVPTVTCLDAQINSLSFSSRCHKLLSEAVTL